MKIPITQKLKQIIWYWETYQEMTPEESKKVGAEIDAWGTPKDFYRECLAEIEMHQEINGRLYKKLYPD